MPITEVTQETTPKSSTPIEVQRNVAEVVPPVSIGPKVANPVTPGQSEPKQDSRGFAQKGVTEVKGPQAPVNPIGS
ncbi:MAG: hypothetical protein L0219_07960 [Phycisphaerales bacterium]|nr:hypothetical protein [Phycisphaerales bacterium]MCI0676045.1 hypothetical protein [Phycisphaerales bacterium]